MSSGVITRKDIITDEALQFGSEYSKNVQKAIDKNKELVASLSELSKLVKESSNVKGQKEFQAVKKKEIQLLNQSNKVWKEQDNLEKQLLATKRKNQLATESTSRALAKERVELQQRNRGAREAAKLSSALSGEYEKQSIRLNQLRRRYKDVALTEGESSKNARRLQRDIQRLDGTLKRVDGNVGQFQRSVGNYGNAMRGAAGAARNMMSALGVVGGISLFVRTMRDASNVVRTFESQNATLSAVLQVERSEMQGLSDDAVRLGGETAKTAGEVTGLQIAYARLGFNQQEIIDLTESTISGSIALNAELDATAGLVGAMVNTFDDFSTTDAPVIIDTLSLATAKSALNFEQLAKGLPTVAGAANAAGVPFTRLVALLGKLSDAGIDTSQSATSLRNIFIESAAQGLNYEQILDKIKSSQDRLTASNDEFGKRAAVSATVLSNAIDQTAELDATLQDAAGTAQRMADKELDTLNGALTLLRSKWEGIILETDGANDISGRITNTIRFLTENLETILKTIVYVTGAWLAYRTLLFSINALKAGYTATVNLLTVAKKGLAGGIASATTAMKGFNTASKANIIGAISAALAIAITSFIAFKNEVKDSAEELANIKKRAEEARDAIVETNIALVKDRISQIEEEVRSEQEALDKKVQFIKEEIKERESGNRLLQEVSNDANKERVQEEEKINEDLLSLQDKFSQKRNQQEKESIDERSRLMRESGGQTMVETPLVLDQTAEEKTVEELKKLLDELQKERTKSSKELQKENEERLQKERDDEVKLIEFLNNYKIEKLNELAQDETATYQSRVDAIDAATKLELKLVDFLYKEKLKKVDKNSSQEKLLIAQREKEKQDIVRQSEDRQDELQIERINSRAEIAKAETEKALNEELEAENRMFLAKEGIYADEERAVENREKRIAEIKKKYAVEALETQIKAIQALLDAGELSAEKRAEYEKQLSELKLGISEITTEDFVEKQKWETLSAQEKFERIQQIALQTNQLLSGLTNALFNSRIEKIDAEIRKNDERYDKLLDNERLTEEERERLQEAQEKKRKELEDERRKEQRKQAVFNKALALAEIAINTAVAVSKVWSQTGVGGLFAQIAPIAMGALQAAAVLAEPIPQYFMGTDDHPGGWARVGEKQPEVIEEPGKKPYIAPKDMYLNLPRHTRVIPSLDEYEAIKRASILSSLQSEGQKLNQYETAKAFDVSNEKMLKEMRDLNANFKKQKQPIHFHERKIDINHAVWRMKNLS